jgi:hypothetical protein
MKGWSRTALLVVIATGAVVASSVFISSWWQSRASPLRRLVSAAGRHRLLRARLTGGYAYAPCLSATPNDSAVTGLLCEGDQPAQWREARSLSELAPDLRAPSAQVNDASRRHALASWSVLWRSPDAAIEELHRAAAVDSSNARVQSDLAVALLQRAEVHRDPASVLDAYAANDSALALDPRLPEGVFNRALILEELCLWSRADTAWHSYLALDKHSAWADEARQHLATLEKPGPTWSVDSKRLAIATVKGDSTYVAEVVRRFAWRVRNDVRATLISLASALLSSVRIPV